MAYFTLVLLFITSSTHLYALSSLLTTLLFPADTMTLAATTDPLHIALWTCPKAPLPTTESNFKAFGAINVASFSKDNFNASNNSGQVLKSMPKCLHYFQLLSYLYHHKQWISWQYKWYPCQYY